MSTTLAPGAEPAFNDDVATMQGVDLSPITSRVRSSRVTFAVGAKSLFFLVGPAGSGKSAIIDLLSLRAQPMSGRLEVLGVNPARVAPSERPRMRRRLGQLFQDHRLLSDLDVFANVALSARIARRQTRDYAPEVSELLLWVGLGGRGEDPISRLTESERRRLCLARALVNRPELLIADDPTRDLGEKAERGFMRLIREVNGAGTPVIFATRDRSLAEGAGGFVYDLPAREAS